MSRIESKSVKPALSLLILLAAEAMLGWAGRSGHPWWGALHGLTALAVMFIAVATGRAARPSADGRAQ